MIMRYTRVLLIPIALALATAGLITPPEAAAQQRATQPPPEFRLSTSQERSVRTSLNAGQQDQLKKMARTLADSPSYRSVQKQWEGLFTQLQGSDLDINAAVQFVLREAYLETQDDLAYYAEKVRAFNESKKALRAEIGRLRDHLSAFEARASEGDQWKDFHPDKAAWSKVPQYQPPAAIKSPEAAESYLQKWDEMLQSVGDDAQLANIDLQNVLEKQQQTLQTLSGMSKMFHDTAMAVIKKIGG